MEIINPHRFVAAPTVDFDGFGNASRYFDGVNDYIDLGDSDDFSFGDSVNDSPFSVCAWVNMNDATTFRIMSKFFQATTAQEWEFTLGGTDQLFFSVYGSNGATRITRGTSAAYTSLEGQWVHFAATYDGSSSSTGIALYKTEVGGTTTRIDANTFNVGTHIASQNTTANVRIGRRGDFTTSAYANGNIADARIYNRELSSAEIQSIADGENITTNLVGHWLKDTPSLLDHSGTNDGTNSGSAFAYDNPSPAVEFGKASRVFDGVNDYIDLGDSDDFSFGDSINDSPFSVCAWVKMTDATLFRFLVKSSNNNNTEWLLANGSDDRLTWAIYDASMSVYRGIRSQFSLTQYENQWIHIAATYDGRGGSNANDGMSCYLTTVGGSTTKLARNIFAAGTYVAMHNTIAPARIGEFNNVYGNGSMADMRLYSKELSSAEVQSIANGTHLETNLVGHWLTNPDDVKDYAGVNDGTNFGSTYSFDNPLGDGEFGSASRSFNGTSHYIDLGDVLDSVFAGAGKKFTIASWVKTTVLENTDFLSKYLSAGNQRSFTCRVLSDGNLAMVMSGDGEFGSNRWGRQTDTSPISANTWHHVAITYDQTATGDYLRMWVDGVEDATLVDWLSNGTFTSIYNGTADLQISGIHGGFNELWGGNIADCRIYDAALSAQDIFDISRGYDLRTNLIGHWLTNKDDVDDYAGTNHGTNNGSTYSLDAPL